MSKTMAIPIPSTKTLVVFAPHPDDAEIFCGGIIVKYRRAGFRAVIICVTSGNRGHLTIPPEELARIRESEARRSAVIADVELVWLGWEDTQVEANLDNRQQIIEALRGIEPDLVLCPDLNDYHVDHREVGRLVTDASYLLGVPQLKTDSEACPPPQIYFYESHGGIGFSPEIWVDISPFFTKKLTMLECHKSQIEWLKEHDGFDLLAYTEAKDRWHGFQSGCQYAEVFRPYRVFPVRCEELI